MNSELSLDVSLCIKRALEEDIGTAMSPQTPLYPRRLVAGRIVAKQME